MSQVVLSIKMGKIIAFTNQKGGVGKSTTAVNVSGFLAQTGKNIILVDMDPQGNASSGIGIDTQIVKKTIYEVLSNKVSCSEAILASKYKNLSVIPANIDLAGISSEISQEKGREYFLKTAIKQIVNNYDYIIIDCPPNLGLLTLNVLCAANHILIPMQTEYYSLEGLSQLIKVVYHVKKTLNPDIILSGVILTMFDQRTLHAQQVVNDVRKHLDKKVYKTIIPRNVKLSEAPSFGKFIGDYAPSSLGSMAYKELSEEIEKRI